MAELRQPDETLALISTHWPSITDPVKFVMRYSPAIRCYLQVLLPPSSDVDEVLQEFLVVVLERGFSPERVSRGRFRDYLIATVRYHAWRHVRRRRPRPLSDEEAGRLEAPAAMSGTEWIAGWRQCLLERAWEAVELRERQSPGNWHYTVLKLTTDSPDADSKELAARMDVEPPMTPAAFRKQLSRARAAFARALVEEVGKTFDNPTPEAIVEELAEVGLLEFVRPYL